MTQTRSRMVRTPRLLAAILTLLLSAALHAASIPAPKSIAVLMYADWCPSCKILDPKLQAVQPEFAQSGILFLRFDFTDAGTTHQSSMLAHSLGLSELYERNGGRTGYMVLVDRATGQVTTRITKDHSEPEIQLMFDHAAGR